MAHIDPWWLYNCIKFGIFGGLSIATLFLWKANGVNSQSWHKLIWANPLAYGAWILVVAAATILDGRPGFRWIAGSSLPANLVVALPLLAAIGSFACLIASFVARKGDKFYVAVVSLLMLIVWASSVVAPN